ncbi:hypothetical protein [Microbulbifer sp. PSTR4-B]|uniref:hypothetical protein n=1 Tax=Microbulbifer sp. PSTR4-B TaxID=3243396 RepID=UPI004039C478
MRTDIKIYFKLKIEDKVLINMKLIKLGFCLGVTWGFATSQAQAVPLTGACYDYASRESTSQVSYDASTVGILLANNLISTALGANDAFVTAKTIYPFVYSAVKGGVIEESTDGADADLVSCLEEFNTRISSLESDLITDQVDEIYSIIDTAETDIKAGRDSGHLTAASDLGTLATSIGQKIIDRLGEPDEGSESNATYDALVESAIPGFISAIQMEFLHRAEFDRYCYLLDNPPTWNEVEVDELVSYDVLDDIYSGAELIENLLAEGDDSDCDLGYSSFDSYKSITSGYYNEVLTAIGIEVSESSKVPGLITTSVNFTDSDLADYREALISNCSGSDKRSCFTDDYRGITACQTGATDEAPEKCESARESYISDYLENESPFHTYDSEVDRKYRLHNLAYVVDTWDLNNLIMTQYSGAGGEADPETYHSVNLKHEPSNLCADRSMSVEIYCDSDATQFVFTPNSDGYLITLSGTMRNFKDGGDGKGFYYTTGSGDIATWYVESTDDGLYQIENKYTGNCLAIDENNNITVDDCDADSAMWDINGTIIPTTDATGLFVRLRSLEEGEEEYCLGGECDEYDLQIMAHNGGYKIKSVSTGTNLSLDGNLTWYLKDRDNDGKFELSNKTSGLCITVNEGLVFGTCEDGTGSEVWMLDIPALPTTEILAMSNSDANDYCLGEYTTLSGRSGYGFGGCSYVIVQEHNGGYLIVNAEDGTYMEDLDLGTGYDSLSPTTTVSDSSIWDFIGPYTGDVYQIKNRETGECLGSTEVLSNTFRVSKLDCSSDSSKLWSR